MEKFNQERENAVRPPTMTDRMKYEAGGFGVGLIDVDLVADLEGLKWKPPPENFMSSVMTGYAFGYENLKKVTSVVTAKNNRFSITVMEYGTMSSKQTVFTFECEATIDMTATGIRNLWVKNLEDWIRYIFHATQIVCLDTGGLDSLEKTASETAQRVAGTVAEIKSHAGQMTGEQMAWVEQRIRRVLQEAFRHIDHDGDGVLTVEEISRAMLLSPTKSRTPEQGLTEAEQFIKELDHDENNVVAYHEWKVHRPTPELRSSCLDFHQQCL